MVLPVANAAGIQPSQGCCRCLLVFCTVIVGLVVARMLRQRWLIVPSTFKIFVVNTGTRIRAMGFTRVSYRHERQIVRERARMSSAKSSYFLRKELSMSH